MDCPLITLSRRLAKLPAAELTGLADALRAPTSRLLPMAGLAAELRLTACACDAKRGRNCDLLRPDEPAAFRSATCKRELQAARHPDLGDEKREAAWAAALEAGLAAIAAAKTPSLYEQLEQAFKSRDDAAARRLINVEGAGRLVVLVVSDYSLGGSDSLFGPDPFSRWIRSEYDIGRECYEDLLFEDADHQLASSDTAPHTICSFDDYVAECEDGRRDPTEEECEHYARGAAVGPAWLAEMNKGKVAPPEEE